MRARRSPHARGPARRPSGRRAQEGVDACQHWGALYQRCARALATAAPARAWDFDATPAFAHVDAFVQRCRCATREAAMRRRLASGEWSTPAPARPQGPARGVRGAAAVCGRRAAPQPRRRARA